MTLEETIAKCEAQVEILIESMNACDLDDPVEKLLARNDAKGADEQRQLAQWLKELAERRKLPEIIRCSECVHSNKEYSGEMWCGICNGFGIDENSFCSFAEKRYVENG